MIRPLLKFQCKCGAVQAELKHKPIDCTCFCHSCVASAKFIEAKPGFDGYSALTEEEGFAYSLVKGKDITFTTDILSEEAHKNLDYVKVGPEGKAARTYCKTCKTVLGGFEPTFAFLNRNSIFNQDDTPYIPLATHSKTVVNMMKKYAFDPAKVPEPSVQMFPAWYSIDMLKFFPLTWGFGGKVAPKDSACMLGRTCQGLKWCLLLGNECTAAAGKTVMGIVEETAG